MSGRHNRHSCGIEDANERRARLKPTNLQLRVRASDDCECSPPETQQDCYHREQAYRRGFQQALSLLADYFRMNDPEIMKALVAAEKARYAKGEIPNFMHRVGESVAKQTGRKMHFDWSPR